MRKCKRAKSIALPFPGETLALGILFFVISLFLASHAFGESEPHSCKSVDALQKEKQRQQDTLTRMQADPAMQTQVSAVEERIANIQARIYDLEPDCIADKQKLADEQNDCRQKANDKATSDLYEIVDGTCTMKEVGTKANPNEGECNAAEILAGTNLKGEACKNTAQTIKNVQAQQDSVGAATNAAVQGFSSYQATMATGAQSDAQLQQKKILQGAGAAKIATSLLQMAGAAQLKSAASKATAAASGISDANQNLLAKCDSAAVKRENLTNEQCFYKYAPEQGIIGTAKEYANFERLQMARNQSQEQADRANEMAKASMMSGMADAFVGIQAMMMARQTQQNGDNMGVPPAPIVGYNIGGASQGGLTPGGGATPGTADGPTDFGGGGLDGGNFIGGGGGGVGNGIQGGKGFALTPGSKAEKSTVSTASGGGGGGGGGGGASRNNGGRKGSGPSNTASGEINLAGGGGGFHGGSGPAEKSEGGNAFAEALAKLFPQDSSGKPVVESRQLASESHDLTQDAFVGSDVEAVDVSLFEQITAKYRQLTNNGSI